MQQIRIHAWPEHAGLHHLLSPEPPYMWCQIRASAEHLLLLDLRP